MASATAVRQAGRQYVSQNVAGPGADIDFVGMTDVPNGTRVGFDVREATGPSIPGAIFGGLMLGLVGLLASLLLGLLLLIVLPSPQLLVLVALVLGGGGAILGAQVGSRSRTVEHVTVTVDASGQVVMVNTDLSTGEFSRSLEREYDARTSMYGEVISEASKHWLLHKLFDRYT